MRRYEVKEFEFVKEEGWWSYFLVKVNRTDYKVDFVIYDDFDDEYGMMYEMISVERMDGKKVTERTALEIVIEKAIFKYIQTLKKYRLRFLTGDLYIEKKKIKLNKYEYEYEMIKKRGVEW